MPFGNGQTYTKATMSDDVTEQPWCSTTQCGSIVGLVDVVKDMVSDSVGKCNSSMQSILETTLILSVVVNVKGCKGSLIFGPYLGTFGELYKLQILQTS